MRHPCRWLFENLLGVAQQTTADKRCGRLRLRSRRPRSAPAPRSSERIVCGAVLDTFFFARLRASKKRRLSAPLGAIVCLTFVINKPPWMAVEE